MIMKRRKFLTTTLATAATTTLVKAHSEPKKPQPFVVKNGMSRFGETTKLGGISPNDIKVSSKDTNGQLTIFEYIGREKGGPGLHIHPNQDEIFFVQEGKYKFKVAEEIHYLVAGDTIFLPRNIPHAFAQLSDSGKMLFFFQPSGKMEDFFRALGNLTGPPTPEIAAKLGADHEMIAVGPPLSLD
jgi:quercetin dioxygenase-like cupin family protein